MASRIQIIWWATLVQDPSNYAGIVVRGRDMKSRLSISRASDLTGPHPQYGWDFPEQLSDQRHYPRMLKRARETEKKERKKERERER